MHIYDFYFENRRETVLFFLCYFGPESHPGILSQVEKRPCSTQAWKLNQLELDLQIHYQTPTKGAKVAERKSSSSMVT